MSSTSSSTSDKELLKILLLRSLQRLHTVACQIILNPFRIFLLCETPSQHSYRENKFGGVTTIKPSHLITPSHTFIALGQWSIKWFADSSTPSHITQFKEIFGDKTCLCERFTFVGVLLWSFQENATTLDGATFFQMHEKTFLCSNVIIPSSSTTPSNFLYIYFTVNLLSPSNLCLQTSSSCLPLNPSKSSIISRTNSCSHTKSGRLQEKAQLTSIAKIAPNSPTFASFCVDKEKSLGNLSHKVISPL